jgi:peptidoglycan/LPS O-acetylase OafA/YrhL
MEATTIKSNLVQGRLLPGLHGLRGIAAISVLLFHLKHIAGIELPAFFSFIARDFGYSVHLFFIVSAFSLMYSTEKMIGRSDWICEYFIKRLFRIAPLFYFMVIFELFRQFYYGKISSSLTDIFLNISFAFGFVPFSGFVWGGWSIGVEMIFYVVFPVLLLLIRDHKMSLLFLIVSVITCYAIRSALRIQHMAAPEVHRWDWSYFSFASNFCFFAFGIYAYHIVKIVKETSVWTRMVIPVGVTCLIGSFWIWDVAKKVYSNGRLDLMLWATAFMLLTIWQYQSPSRVVANRFFQYVGERSFSVYLLHPVFISLPKSSIQDLYAVLLPYCGQYAFFVCAVAVLTVVLAFSELTYRLIEVRGINLGRTIIHRRRQILSQQPSAVG